jgi:hypothetical protein
VSNDLAIATVSAALKETLVQALPRTLDEMEVKVVTGRPEAPSAGDSAPKVTVFLYQVTPNPSWRNADLPTRRSDGTAVQRPQAAVDLHYLISFFGEEKNQVPERLLGLVLSTFHAKPILAHDRIVEASTGPLDGSDLADQVEAVRLTPVSMTLEELSKLWAVFFQIPYRLSLAYQASVVLIDVDVPMERALPVLSRHIEAKPLPENVPGPAGGLERPVIVVGAPAGNGASRTLPVTVTPPVGSGQKALLLLNEHGGARSFAVLAPPRTTEINPLMFPLPAQAVGTYLVRVEVDGVESLLELEPNPNDPDTPASFSGPLVTLLPVTLP